MNDLVERVAIAMWAQDTFCLSIGRDKLLWENGANETTKKIYRLSAKTAIEAVRRWDRESGASNVQPMAGRSEND